jgi:putative metallohydrolase (TIGR04338 family)
MRERDQQRSRVYKAERIALAQMAAPLATVRDIERFVKRVFGMKRVQDAFPKATSRHWDLPTVGDGRGRRNACGWDGGIKIPLWARNEWVVIHELAHTISWREYGYKTAGHGWQFCAVYLKLVLYCMGREAHDVLKRDFKVCRVRYTAPRKRKPMDPARKAELVARLAAYRAARKQTAPVMRPEPLFETTDA